MLIRALRTVYLVACDVCRMTSEPCHERAALRVLVAVSWRVDEDGAGVCKALCPEHRGGKAPGWFMALSPRGAHARKAAPV